MSFDKYTAKRSLQTFEDHYNYDATYLHDVLESSLDAFEVFSNFQAMGHYRKVLPVDVFFVSKIAAAQTEDCGPCTELNVRMAQEAGLSDEVIKSILKGTGLKPELEQVRQFSISVAYNEVKPGQVEEIRDRYGNAGLAELALSIASMRVYPCMKRALGYDQSCSVTDIAV